MQARAAGTARNDQGAAVCYVCPVPPSRCERGERCEWCLAWVSSIWWGKPAKGTWEPGRPQDLGGLGPLPRRIRRQGCWGTDGGWNMQERGSISQPTHPNHTRSSMLLIYSLYLVGQAFLQRNPAVRGVQARAWLPHLMSLADCPN